MMPICLIFDKIIEKILHKQLYAFLEKHNVPHQYQFGFRKNNSTIYALTQITEMIKVSIDSGKYGCGIFIDLRKAFDTVNHDILLLKLEHYGIRDNNLSNRKQYVFLNGESSEVKDITCGAPQGSALGPSYYTSMIFRISLKYWIFIYLLMTLNIYYENDNLDKLERKVNKEFYKLQLRLNVNRLSLN